VALAACAAVAARAAESEIGAPPSGFTSANVQVNGTSLHYVRGGEGPALILLHGFPQTWAEYQPIMPRLAKRFTVVAVDLPGVGKSSPAANGYDSEHLSADVHALVAKLDLKHAYLVGHDLGGIVTYAYVRRFGDSLRGAMILDVPMPGIEGWDEAVKGAWHIGFIQVPGLAEKVVPGRQEAVLGYFLDFGKFTPAERAYSFRVYDAPQLHAAFEIYRAFPKDGEFNAAQTAPNATPLLVAFGEKSPFAPLLTKFVAGYRAQGMTHVESTHIPGAMHYVVADNPQAVAELIERYATR
jgi:pimeloyl-ACP methyl ester carboxylesterase